jgi:hypothetical protein
METALDRTQRLFPGNAFWLNKGWKGLGQEKVLCALKKKSAPWSYYSIYIIIIIIITITITNCN